MPLYRERPPADSTANRRKMLLTRRLLTGSMLCLSVFLAVFGIDLIEFLYDERYHAAGPMIVLFSLAAVPRITFIAYDNVLIANGDTRRYFILLALTTSLQVAFLLAGIWFLGITGAILGPTIAVLLSYPLRVRFVGRYKANDNAGDVLFIAAAGTLCGLAMWWHWADLQPLFA